MTRWAKIRFLVATVTVAAVLGGIWLTPGAASVRAKYSEADCEALLDLGKETPDVSGGGSFDSRELKAQATGFAATAKKIKNKKLKSAMNTLAGIFEDASKAKNAAGALAVTIASGKKYAKALTVWGKANLQCVTSNLTLPTLPDNVTLPRNLTLPTLPGNITIPSIPSIPSIPR